ncbi:MAG: hypothetical protein ABEJ98_04795 [Candidatus Nanohaloarchaea archaeon]
MSDNPLTFSELRKIEKKEKRQEELSEIQENFLLRVSEYLDRKQNSSDSREYRNAKRVFDKIIGLRQQKIVRNARVAVKSDRNASDLELLPREKELFLDLKQRFSDYSEDIEDFVENPAGDMDMMETGDESEEEEAEEAEEDYTQVKITGDVPEFMGTDLESYGPFEEGEEVEIPEDNAEILVNRGNAEVVE